MIKYIWPLVRIIQFVSYTPSIIKNINNWKDYYKDVFSHEGYADFWVMEVEDIRIKLRAKSVDRWSALENLVLGKQRLPGIADRQFDTIIDLGANIGASVLDFYQHFPQADIIAVEPNSQNIVLLKENIELNNIQKKVKLIQAAVSDSQKDKVKLYINRNDAESSLVKKMEDEYEMVDNINFNDLDKLIKGKTLLKMDIEGQEYGFTNKAHLSLLKKFEFLIIESHNISKIKNSKEVERFLDSNSIEYRKRGRFYFIDSS